MFKVLKMIGLLIAIMLLTACVHHGYNRGYTNNGYYPGYGNQGYRNSQPYRQQYNQRRPPAYSYRQPNNNYYNQNNYYNRQQPRQMRGYGYQQQPRYNGDGYRDWRHNNDRHDYRGHHGHHDHD